MRGIKILDCTLRDGGYCIDWVFERRNIDKIVNALGQAGVDFIEYGYWDKGCRFSMESTRFPSLTGIPAQIKKNGLVMINYGETDADSIPDNEGKIWGIRVAFHKKDKEGALLFCKELKEKGYQVFIQPMVTGSYSEDEFCQMIERINEIGPYAFYIVDSFGSMQADDVRKYAELTDARLDERIGIGFHGHDNLRLAFMNAAVVVRSCKNHFLCIDSTVMGMGRGAGNLGTENILEYCNRYQQANYNIQPVLKVIDEVIGHFYAEKPWGYTLPFYIAARQGCHPDYARYLDGKKTLTITGMDEIFCRIPDERKYSFDRQYIEKAYYEYMTKEAFDYRNEDLWKKRIRNRKILLLGPGKTILEKKDDIAAFIKKEKPIVISVNFEYAKIESDYIFMSNQRRYREWTEDKKNDSSKLIVTSNIPSEKYYLKVKYSLLLSKDEMISDNAGLMAIRFLLQYQVEEIMLAGFDGYQYDEHLNYISQRMEMDTVRDRKNRMNASIKREIGNLSEEVRLKSLTPSIYFDSILYS